jgi:uncharacterized protein (DUF2235 family)
MKRLIVCSDGTWFTDTPKPPSTATNVVIVRDALPPHPAGSAEQVVFYDPGVGTRDNFLDKWLGGAFGIGLGENVKDCYRFLVENFNVGDEIFFFGFSRGAFTVRSTAGLIRKCGILRRAESRRISRAYEIYRHRDTHDPHAPDTKEACDFRDTFSHYPVRIRFIGVWDTVGSLGIPIRPPLRFLNPLSPTRYEFHDTDLSRSVDYAYHAVAIDEMRGSFRPTLWRQHDRQGEQVMEQAWFAGVHNAIGGGFRATGLSSVALHWMVGKARALGLAFDDETLGDYVAEPLAPVHGRLGFPFSLLSKALRPIGEGCRSNESLHPAVRERIRNDAAYARHNLERYLIHHEGDDPE